MVSTWTNSPIYMYFFDQDLVCLTETWMKPSETQNLEVRGFTCINKPRSRINKRAKRGSGGILLYIRDMILSSVEILNDPDVDDRIWIKLIHNGRDNVTLLCFCYIPSTATLNENSHWSQLESEVINYSSIGNVLICGDTYAQTGILNDYIEEDAEIPVDTPPELHSSY